MKGERLRRNIAIVITSVFLAIAIIYPTYAIFQSMTEDVRHLATALGFEQSPEGKHFIETTEMRNQTAMSFLIIVEIVCIAVAMGSMLSIKP